MKDVVTRGTFSGTLAGAHGIDLVLFTVAADDGVMPQTIEHLDILHLLGVGHAIFVITKIDLATPTRVAEVEEEIQILTAGGRIQGCGGRIQGPGSHKGS